MRPLFFRIFTAGGQRERVECDEVLGHVILGQSRRIYKPYPSPDLRSGPRQEAICLIMGWIELLEQTLIGDDEVHRHRNGIGQ